MRVTKTRLVLNLNLIDRGSGASFLDQSYVKKYRKSRAMLDYFRHSTKNFFNHDNYDIMTSTMMEAFLNNVLLIFLDLNQISWVLYSYQAEYCYSSDHFFPVDHGQ